ncbi:DBH-like monooxygenase protein 1 [Dermatophagoides pteronyssinus]|uniref:DBH-like monooxygenase protein 1 n=1 Tax=Dermatophagoides pteronyssinus TaxID=6956 RepID=A0ABQ8JV14_DERPT|nr:DBH-like monooxygenase protein 1 [Dermatophagoides pteronyssinus]
MVMRSPLIIIISLFIWSLQSIDTLEIWSVYFDETQEFIHNEVNQSDNRLIRQIVNIPFDNDDKDDQQIRYINEIRTYIENPNEIIRMELILCDEINNDDDDDQMILEELLFTNENQTKFLCIQRLAAIKWPNIEHNQTLIQYPSNIGIAFNHYQSPEKSLPKQTLLLSIEYSNDFKQIIDQSGFDLYLFDQTEINIEAGIIAVGFVPDSFFFLPPKLNHWSMKGVCKANNCIQNTIENEIQILSVVLGTNHHYLDEINVEIIDQQHKRRQQIFHHKNGQQKTFEMLIETPTVRAMDKIIVECNYINTSNRTVRAGLENGDKNENCLVWLHYYPRIIGMDACLSTHSLATIISLLDIHNLDVSLTRSNGIDLRISDNDNHHGKHKQLNLDEFLNKKDQNQDWNQDKLIRAKYNSIKGKQISKCGWNPMQIDLNHRRRRR